MHSRLTLLSDERETPREDVHEVRQPVRMRGRVELADVEHVLLVLEDRAVGKDDNGSSSQHSERSNA